MTDIRLPPVPPVPPIPPVPGSGRPRTFKILLWLLAFAILGAAWITLLASVAPARLNFSSAGALLMVCAPPVLVALLGWTGVHFFRLRNRRCRCLLTLRHRHLRWRNH